jgi:hypothetical protein
MCPESPEEFQVIPCKLLLEIYNVHIHVAGLPNIHVDLGFVV